MSARLRSRLRLVDAAALGAGGLTSRPLRACFSALGARHRFAAAVAVLGISASSRAGLLAQLASEGNILTVTAGRSFTGQPASLPLAAQGMIRRIPPVENATGVGFVQGATVRRTAAVNKIDTGGIAVLADQPSLLGTVDGRIAHGTFLNDATASFPAVVLGFNAAQSLGLDRVPLGEQVYLAGRYFTVIGILRPVPAAPEIDSAALVGFPVAGSLLGLDGHPTTIYLRAPADRSRPSPPSCPSRAKSAFAGLFLGLGAVAILVGGVGIANVMVISVLECRGEIGLRRALGATRTHVAFQFLVESSLLALAGGVGPGAGGWGGGSGRRRRPSADGAAHRGGRRGPGDRGRRRRLSGGAGIPAGADRGLRSA